MMSTFNIVPLALLVLLSAPPALAMGTSNCRQAKSSLVAAPKVAKGYKVDLVKSGLSSPRAIKFDGFGHLLVVESGGGVTALTMSDKHGCVKVTDTNRVVSDSTLNHGLEVSHDGKYLYASSEEAAFRWRYDPQKATVTSEKEFLVKNMSNDDHNTRTLLLSKKKPGTLVINRGSASNIDAEAMIKSSGHAQVKAFDLKKRHGKVFDFPNDGKLLAWGVRNDVGIAEEPLHGGIYSVENSVDEISRYGVNFHENNPGEELNYMGTLLNNQSPNQGRNFGYPTCVSAWRVEEIPRHRGIKTGTQFAVEPGQNGIDDAWCRKHRVAPRLVFQAHMAPLSLMFEHDGSHAWVTFHGSWDRTNPAGYAVAKIKFADGHPVEPSTSKKAAHFIVENNDVNSCPNSCFRPVGIARDRKGRIFFSSDQTGEIYMITSA